MQNRPEPACLVIADIAGYTSYLAGVELDHAQDILADLMDTVVRSLRPAFRLAKLEGDAAFAYALTATIDGSLLQDTVEATYFAFRRRLRDIKQASQCECNACILIPSLDLKLVVHHGEIVRHRIAGREELVGAAVILAHRLLKNRVGEALGLKAYALYTQGCIDASGIDPLPQGLRRHVETTDIAGDVVVWARDLEALWSADESGRRHRVPAARAYWSHVADQPAPPMLVWDYLTSPIRRPQWGTGIIAVEEDSPAGRRGVGTVNHCIHGRDAIVEETLDWEPGRSWTTRSRLPTPGLPPVLMTYDLEPLPSGGTRVTVRIGRPKPHDRAAFEAMFPMVEPMIVGAERGIAIALGGELARQASAPREPEVSAGTGRFLTDPVDSAGGRTSSS